MSTLVHWRGEGVKIGQNLVHVVVECPQLYFPVHNLLYLAFFLNTLFGIWPIKRFALLQITVYNVNRRVSNGTEFSCPRRQRDRRPLIVPGQRRQWERIFLSQGKGTMGQAQKVATGQEGTGFFEAVPFRPSTSHQILLVWKIILDNFGCKTNFYLSGWF